MSLLTKEQTDKIPAIYSQEGVEDPTVFIKLTLGSAFWLITEIDVEEQMAFGYGEIIAGCGELGYLSLEELDAPIFDVKIEEVNTPLSKMKEEMQWTSLSNLKEQWKD